MAELVEKLNVPALPPAPPAQSYAGDVMCDFCPGRAQKALKSCLDCQASYCETHLRPHSESPAFKEHVLLMASTEPQEKKVCSQHCDEVLDFFCRTDHQCICCVCAKTDHKGHKTASAKTVRKEKQVELDLNQKKVQMRIQFKKRELKKLQLTVEIIDEAVTDSERIFNELIHSIEKRRHDVKELIRAQQKEAVSRTEGLLERLEQEIAELSIRNEEMEKLSHTEDDVYFIESATSLSTLNICADQPNYPLQYFSNVKEVLSQLKEKIEDIVTKEWPLISKAVNTVDVLQPSESKLRADFLQYACQLTMDPNTAFRHILMSNGNRKIVYTREVQSYPKHPGRFEDYCQVMSTEELSGPSPFYWEVEWNGWVYIAVSYKEIVRKGSGLDALFGFNAKSWSLVRSADGYCFRHRNIVTAVSGVNSSRIGVFLDHAAGTLAFYSVSDTMILLQRVNTTFTQPLHAGFWLYGGAASAELCELE
ncbi:tripartite motif-containing protein 16-like [Aplochiton taeniatus]